MILEIIAIFSSITSMLLLYTSYKYYKESKIFQNLLVKEYMKDSGEDDAIREEFLKFVSDSREWAFEYIENVQQEIDRITKYVHPVIFDRENRDYTNTSQAEVKNTLETVYKDLQKLLPEQDK